jgi:hypothetical protein
MSKLTIEEQNLMCIYSGSGTRVGLISALEEMRGYLQPDEVELRELTDSTLAKLRRMTDENFEALDLCPDFTPEDPAYGE